MLISLPSGKGTLKAVHTTPRVSGLVLTSFSFPEALRVVGSSSLKGTAGGKMLDSNLCSMS